MLELGQSPKSELLDFCSPLAVSVHLLNSYCPIYPSSSDLSLLFSPKFAQTVNTCGHRSSSCNYPALFSKKQYGTQGHTHTQTYKHRPPHTHTHHKLIHAYNGY